jgi:hypothetical protein
MNKKGVKKSWPKRKKEKKVVVKVEAPIVEQTLVPEGPLCACGKSVAPGQSAVCKDHIRTN